MPQARSIAAGGITLATEAFGAAGDPAMVLVMGATASMLSWPEALCEALAAQGRFVLRFDHRDTGGSTTRAPGAPAYSVEDMAGDVLAVMDGWGVGAADVVGMSLGGYIAQVAALTAPARVRSLVLIGAEPLGWDGEELPGISPDFLAQFDRLSTLDWSDRDAVADFMLDAERLCAVDPALFDEAAERRRIERILDRTQSPQSAFNHGMVSLAGDWTGRAGEIACPVLVLHGARDPILPLPNGEAIARTIPGARLSVMDGVGHSLPASWLSRIAQRIDDFLGLPLPARN